MGILRSMLVTMAVIRMTFPFDAWFQQILRNSFGNFDDVALAVL